VSSEPFDPADQATPAGLGDRFDDLLLRIEAWVAQSRTTAITIAVLATAIVAAWLTLSGSRSQAPIEASIPLATSAPPGADTAGPGIETADATEGGADGEDAADGGADDDSGESGSGAGGGENDERAGSEELIVHVVGSVRRPGLVRLAPGDRISDAVDAAGGGRPDADLDRLNLASLAVDGMQVRVPSVEESIDGEPPDGPLIQLPASGGAGANGGDGQDPALPVGPIDVNRADEAELQRLPGIGPALAARILAWRADNGGFTSVDELEAVPGIGPAKLAGLRDLVTV